ncbi:MAG: PAS domain S-box protein [Spirochaetia bacterium]|nr:PAS domain S-box protein [Spirochaetia bacterium]
MSNNHDDKPIILVVEDEQIVALDLTRTLESLGYTVLPPVETGEKALEVISAHSLDLVLLDVKLKGELDGIETAQYLRRRFSIPFIFLSTFSDEDTLSRAKKTEPYGYITKSSHQNDLHSMIEMALYRHKMELEARKNEEILSITLKSINDAVIGATLDGTIISWNKGAEKIFGYTEEDVRGKNLLLLTPPFYPNELPDILDKIGDNIEVEHYETVRQRKNGEVINISLKINPIRGLMNEVTGVSLIARDITAKKQLEREILEISEKERRRIGKDLHDNLGQNLTGISLQLKLLENKLQESECPEEVESARRIQDMVNQSIKQTRNLAKNLLTVTLENQGLSVALKELTLQIESLYNCKIECKTDLENDITDGTMATQLYHIAQEAITNAKRYGDAEKIEILLKEEDSEYFLQVRDNGKGIERHESQGLGLKIMEFRSNIINGHLSIFDNEHSGTTVICRVPKFHPKFQ